jgi:hypothetical protein
MKKWLAPLMLGFGIALAVIIGQRMSTDAMAVVIGVAVGVAASVPTSVLLVSLLRRERKTWQGQAPPPDQPAYPALPQPPVIVLNPADFMNQRGNQPPPMPLPPPQWGGDGGMRHLRVVGDDDDWME